MDALADAPIRVLSSAQTDVGRIRQNNEDAFLCEPELGLYAVADGMGGHVGGEVASAMAIEGLRRAVAHIPDAKFLTDPSLENRRELLSFLSKTVASLNAEIYTRGQADPTLRGMGCTLDVALIRGRSLFLAHVGDSRVYGLLGGTLYPLTEDHTFGQTLLSGGAMTVEEVSKHPQRNLLMRALGVYPKVEVDTAYLDIAPGDVFLLCSDGVHGLVDRATMEAALRKPSDFAAQTLIDAALDAGGRDNATAVVVQVAACTKCQPLRVGSEEVRSAMAEASLFGHFTQSELLRIQRIAMGRIVHKDEFVFHIGQPLTEVYLVIDGQTSDLER
jgi:serine/threonine protein phosphatase PrpC